MFGRGLEIFPPQVIDVADTFFSQQVPITPTTPGRRYLGVCAHGVRLKSAEIRLAEILLIAGQTMLDSYGAAADPYLMLVGYFNATRELARHAPLSPGLGHWAINVAWTQIVALAANLLALLPPPGPTRG